MLDYESFIDAKKYAQNDFGFAIEIGEPLFDYQRVITQWACLRGRAAIFADTGLGKTIMQLTWADAVASHCGMPVLVVAPLAVSIQTEHERSKLGIDPLKVVVTNYEKIERFAPSDYAGIVLDESSILKGNGSMRKSLTEFGGAIDYRLSCTATPSPNDFMELGTQSEFLGVMNQEEMLAEFFVHDGSETQKWRLKGHAKERFFEWMATWSIMIKQPSDLGFESSSHELPPIEFVAHIADQDPQEFVLGGDVAASGLMMRNKARKESVQARCELAASIVNGIDRPVLVYCNRNDESDLLTQLIDCAVEVRGSDTQAHKERALIGFANGDLTRMVTKPKIAGFGMNFQVCCDVVFTGLTDSWEQFYQSVRRVWRFGQMNPVTIHSVSAPDEAPVVENLRRKDTINESLCAEMVKMMRRHYDDSVFKRNEPAADYESSKTLELPSWV